MLLFSSTRTGLPKMRSPRSFISAAVGRFRGVNSLAQTTGAVTQSPQSCTVVVGMSGGVDSSVSALLLKRAGWNVIGVFMKNWDASDETGVSACTSSEDYKSAYRVCQQLGIPLRIIDLSRQYWLGVFTPFLESYARGDTPHPDVECNRVIKFGAFKSAVAAMLSQDAAARFSTIGGSSTFVPPHFLATGHYAQLWPPVALDLPKRITAAGVSAAAIAAGRQSTDITVDQGATVAFAAGFQTTATSTSFRHHSAATGKYFQTTLTHAESRTSNALAQLQIEAMESLLPPEHAFSRDDDDQSTARSPTPRLFSAVDRVKDQSDFLAAVPGAAFRRVIFPIGSLPKSRVRDIALAAGLSSAARKDSYGICFIGKKGKQQGLGQQNSTAAPAPNSPSSTVRSLLTASCASPSAILAGTATSTTSSDGSGSGSGHLESFLSSYLSLTPGAFIDVTTGAEVGRHRGAELFTCGQGARIGGLKSAYYVVNNNSSGDLLHDGTQQLDSEASRHLEQAASQGQLLPSLFAASDTAHLMHASSSTVCAPPSSATAVAPAAAHGPSAVAAAAAASAPSLSVPPSSTVWVAPARDHPSLFFDSLVANLADCNWVNGAPTQLQLAHDCDSGLQLQLARPPLLRVRYRIRHRQEEMGRATISIVSKRAFEEEQRGLIASGAAAATATINNSNVHHPAAMRLAEVDNDSDSSIVKSSSSSSNCTITSWRVGGPPRVHSQVEVGSDNGSIDTTRAAHVDDDGARLLLVVRFDVPQRAVSRGQVITLYRSDDSAAAAADAASIRPSRGASQCSKDGNDGVDDTPFSPSSSSPKLECMRQCEAIESLTFGLTATSMIASTNVNSIATSSGSASRNFNFSSRSTSSTHSSAVPGEGASLKLKSAAQVPWEGAITQKLKMAQPWEGATREVLGCVKILSGGASLWDRWMPAPRPGQWVE